MERANFRINKGKSMQVLSKDEITQKRQLLEQKLLFLTEFLNVRLNNSDYFFAESKIFELIEMQTDIVANSALNAIRGENE